MKNFNFSGTKVKINSSYLTLPWKWFFITVAENWLTFGISNMYYSFYHGKPLLCFINNVDKKVDKEHFILFSSMLSFTVSGALDLLY